MAASAFDPGTSRKPHALVCWAWGAVFLGVGAVSQARDWSTADVAWRDDPRPPVDAPDGVAEQPMGRRATRRAQRRTTVRRRAPVEQLPAERPWGVPAGALTTDGPEPFSAPETRSLRLPEERSSTNTIIIHRDHAYPPLDHSQPPHGRQRFDIHLPAGCFAGAMPLVIWIHGDTWRDGSKADCPIAWLATEGYAVASIGYRPSDVAVFPAQLDDCRAAVAEIIRNAEVWGIDPSRVAVAGRGGGGHLAALVGLVNQPASPAADLNRPATARVAAVFAAAAPASLTTLGPDHDRAASPASRLVGGPLPEFREAAQRASPLAHVSPDDPAVLLLHGAADSVIPAAQSVQLDAALRAVGVDSTLVKLTGVGHTPSLSRGTPGGVSLLSFLDRVLGPGIRSGEAPL